MTSDTTLPKAYEFREVEARCYDYWEKTDSFHAEVNGGRPAYSIVIPPPNVTGHLHMGHALNNTLQDILCRYKRLKGFDVLWMPGTDHAGIATQNVVERQLATEHRTRHELGREAFVERVWQWKEKYGGIIIGQLKRIGASCDWARERFTMDAGLSRAVREVFVALYQQGLIYRGQRMINWCPRCMTALANLEVEAEELDSHLYFIKYPIIGTEEGVVVATTRPETMLGDTAVAVNPEDPRYRALVGRNVLLPLMRREIPVIGDAYVDPEFGTGALKVTPAHDFNDFEIGRKHGLGVIQVIGEDGRMTELAGRYAGLDRYTCRRHVINDLQNAGLLVRIDNYDHRVGHCYRCKQVVEPMLSMQWFVATKPLAEKAMAAVRTGETRIIPQKWEKDYFLWLENLEDWCISRQIWWGHRVPAWYCQDCNRIVVSLSEPTTCDACGGTRLEQETDVLDTWFSSALWPFSTMGWPDRTPELEKYYPTSVLVTGFDILFFWVARMMMMGLHFMKAVPFRDVYIHALVRDAQGQKMSKSKGNVIDPLVMVDRYGTDALRFTLTAFAAQGRDVKLSEERIEGYRHFVNKLWNAARLVLMNLAGTQNRTEIPIHPQQLAHRWILSRLQGVIEEVEQALDQYHFNQHAQSLYRFVWHEYCDWYLEMIKLDLYGEDQAAQELARTVALHVLTQILVLLHPIMPFVTEEIWQRLPHSQGTIMKAGFPEVQKHRLDLDAERSIDQIMEVVNGVRNIRGEMNVPPAVRVEATCLCEDEATAKLLLDYRDMIGSLARLERLQAGMRDVTVKPRLAASTVAKNVQVYVHLENILDFESESKRIDKELGKLEKELRHATQKLDNEDFVKKAPAAVIEKEKEKAQRLHDKMEKLRSHRQRIVELLHSTDEPA
ncbi:MAG TPA: valine--tRNA ligase [Syntrophobacteraceae bacterium]|nr:valine--tRNA ligase [Syntrophobacteraceae bacterium]